MGKHSGTRLSITPATNTDNLNLRAGASKLGRVVEVHWGGEATSSTAMCTRVARSSGQTGNATAVNVEKLNPYGAAAGLSCSSAFATTQATLEAGNLFAESWNAHGGVVRWLAAPGEEFLLIGATTELCISCRNSVGTATSSYGIIWEED
jgi:hypothetical protein